MKPQPSIRIRKMFLAGNEEHLRVVSGNPQLGNIWGKSLQASETDSEASKYFPKQKGKTSDSFLTATETVMKL